MAVVKARKQDVDMLARLLRAEAETEGEMGMLLVGNVGINRIRGNCSDFKGIRTIPQMINQPHAFEALQHSLYYQGARDRERRLAQRAVNGERNWPAKFSLWYFRPGSFENPGPCPPTWYNQPFAGRWKKHCFYEPTGEECENVYNTF
ncbi:cell wall hydrolase [Paenibacillus protaetiae]|uniref:Cell wall hydrolase n=1 Tax=Paenibacillus protaetiae TaxID=2509456 RepID=A0A4P6F611_9BACL|nr:cell wall hydrolase [Paenibacillus protaetiae]QAY65828.1 cell wall hydrolase [Paenibacillus protaetiae]